MARRHPPLRYLPYREARRLPHIVVDGAPQASTVLTLSHWPNNATPDRYRRDTSTETTLAWLEDHDPRRVAGVVTNSHFDEDGLFSMFTLLDPDRAWRHRALLADAARAGDFGVYRARAAARLCFIIEGHADPQRSPLPRPVFAGTATERIAALYRALLPRLPRLLARPNGWRRLWQDQDQHLDASEALLASGRVSIEEEPEAMAIASEAPSPLAQRELTEELQRLLACMAALEEERRKMVLLAYYSGWSREQLAAKLGKPVNTIKTWLRRSLIEIRECLGP